MKSVWTLVIGILIVGLAGNTNAQDDVPTQPTHRLHLKTGGEILGHLINASKAIDGRAHVVFQTESGGTVQLEKAALVDKVVVLDDNASAAYKRMLAAAKDPATHWEAVQWCKTQKSGNSKYRSEINYHLRRIVELDPNDKEAWRRITNSAGKPMFKEIGGVWVNQFEMYNTSGYTKSKGSWTSLEAIRVRQDLDRRNNTGVVNDAVNKWKDLIKANKLDEARARLGLIIDASTVVPLFQYATGLEKRGRGKMKPPGIRSMVMEAIANIDSATALNSLVYFAVEDPELEIRSRAATLLENGNQYQPDDVARKVIAEGYLRSPDNLTINRAALLLRRVGSELPIVQLIEALETTHSESTGQRPGGMKAGQRNGRIEGFQAGGGPATRNVLKRNQGVHTALRVLSDKDATKRVDFGYTKALWKSWYIEKYQITRMNVRSDDE